MCGLIGVAGKLDTDAMKAFHQLLVVDQLRGQHSTGVAHVANYNNDVTVLKAIGSPEQLMDTNLFEKTMRITPKVLIGHNRYATSGNVTRNNAHPFEFDEVVGAHNGSLRAYARLPGYGKYEVDSQVLYHGIEELGIDAALAKVVGAYCLTYWDKVDQTMNFIRNAERPLYIAEFNKGQTIAWASEEGMLEWILERNAIIVEEIYNLATDVLVTIPIKGHQAGKLTHTTRTLKGGAEVKTSVVNFRGQQTQQTTTQGTQTTTAAATTPVVTDGREEPDMEAARQKAVVFRCGLPGTSAHGAPFFDCQTVPKDGKTYRLYTNQNNSSTSDLKTGDEIMADTNGLEYIGNSCVYRITASSVKIVLGEVDNDGVILSKIVDAGADSPDAGETYIGDSQGRLLNEANWLKRHGTCSYCSGDINPKEQYQFIKDEILCEDCCVNPIIKDALLID